MLRKIHEPRSRKTAGRGMEAFLKSLTPRGKAIRNEPQDRLLQVSWDYGNRFSERYIRKTTAELIEKGSAILKRNKGDRSTKAFADWMKGLREHCIVISEGEIFFGAILSAVVADAHPEHRGAFGIYEPGEIPQADENGISFVKLAATHGISLDMVAAFLERSESSAYASR